MPAFTLAPPAREKRRYYLAIFFVVFAAPLFAIHLPLLGLPFFWDEQGQFIPTALDLLRHGAWIARSTVPNVHPPGVEAYLVLWYKLFGYSIALTRIAMLLFAALGVLLTFLLAIELSRGTQGAPAFLPVVFLLASPLFYTQSMMAQLDMPAMVLTLLALLLFLQRRYRAAALASVALVLVKETGIVAPLVFFIVLAWRRDWKRAAYFVAPAAALGGWLCVLHHGTGYWLGNPGFAHYNVGYSLHPVRMALSFARRLYYLFIAEFRWIGTAALILAARRATVFKSERWRIAFAVAAANIVLVSVFGGAELERYLLPVLPIFYIAVGVALTYVPRWQRVTATVALAGGLAASLFWNPPYPFPYENNLAMVDFVRLQETAAQFAERNFDGRTIATAWPYTAGLERPDYGFVYHKLDVIETNDFHASSIESLPPWRFDVLITYTRTWAPEGGVTSIPVVRRFLSRFYEWQPDITAEQCRELGLRQVASWRLRGQDITIYARPGAVSGRAARLQGEARHGE
jgi:4-amino-4-deoxy-L-arabinose transferase-like glycosyltransferase